MTLNLYSGEYCPEYNGVERLFDTPGWLKRSCRPPSRLDVIWAARYRAAILSLLSRIVMSRLSEAQFHHLVDQTQRQVEDAYDDSGLDLDLENAGGVLTIKFDNGSQVILSRQPRCAALGGARSGGYHFDGMARTGSATPRPKPSARCWCG